MRKELKSEIQQTDLNTGRLVSHFKTLRGFRRFTEMPTITVWMHEIHKGLCSKEKTQATPTEEKEEEKKAVTSLFFLTDSDDDTEQGGALIREECTEIYPTPVLSYVEVE